MLTSTTLATHKIRQPHCSNSLSNSLSVKWCPQLVIDRRHCYISWHQSRGVGKLRFDIGVMIHIQYGLQMNRWSCSATELVCTRQLYTIKRRSVPSRVCLGVIWRMQWYGEYRWWKWIISTKYIKKENAYIWQNTRCRGAKSQWGDDYYITINDVWPGFSISLRLQHNWTGWNIACFHGKSGALFRHIHEYLKWYWVHSLREIGDLSPHNTNGHLLRALYCGFRVSYDS